MAALDSQAAIVAMRKLYGRPSPPHHLHRMRDPDELLAELRAGAASLATLVDGWSDPPRAGDLAGAVATVEGLRRLLAELQHVSAKEGTTDGN